MAKHRCLIPTCSCKDYDAQINIIDSYIMEESLRQGTDTYLERGGIPFVFCPWCGKKLKREK